MSPARTVAAGHAHGLSKSRFVAGWRCPRYLWWTVHRADAPELRPGVPDRDRMEQGAEVGLLATLRYPGGVLIDLPHDRMQEKIDATRAALAAGAPAIFEASFREDGVFVAVDVLERLPRGFRVIEVKSSTSVKEAHVPDVAVQVHVLRRAGLDVREAVLLHLNKAYRHRGPESLFVAEDVLPQVEAMLPEVPGMIEAFASLLEGPDPGPCVGEHCGRDGNGSCPLDVRCWPQDPDHIRRLHGVGTKKALGFMAEGVRTFDDLPDEARIGEPARRQLEACRRGRMLVEPTLAEHLGPFHGRIGFLDFETVQRAVPPWAGLAPWGQVPVQFSYHERRDDGTYRHEAWLARGWDDPRPGLARALVEVTRSAERVITYTHFERTCIRALAEAVPALAPELEGLIDRLVDLKKVVQDNVAHPGFLGSFSIKDVLTPLVPDLGYEGLEIAEGMTASVELARLLRSGQEMDPSEREGLRSALLAYCERDTWAMVRLAERLEELAAEELEHDGTTGPGHVAMRR